MTRGLSFTHGLRHGLLSFVPSALDAGPYAKAIDALARTPRPEGCTKLAGADDGYRIRIGDYRIVYVIADKVLIVYIIRVAHRKDVYRGM